VVDDNKDVAESTAVLLRMAGCDVHVVYDGDEALQAMPRLRPDAVLLDIGLPKVNGYQVAERIRAEPEHRRTLIVAISGYGQEEHRLQSQQSGFDYHIVKPIDPPVLTRLLASLWSHRGASATENVVSFPQRKMAE
jgi:CheY-like chemotaxis protein